MIIFFDSTKSLKLFRCNFRSFLEQSRAALVIILIYFLFLEIVKQFQKKFRALFEQFSECIPEQFTSKCWAFY